MEKNNGMSVEGYNTEANEGFNVTRIGYELLV
jgi:hypothetical protein